MKKISAVLAIALLVMFVFSCASEPKASVMVKAERQQRAYERYIAEHTTESEEDLLKPGIYVYDKQFWVVISLSDTGVDSYPEWACKKLLSSLSAYDIIDEDEISPEEYSALVLEFEEAGFIEGKITNIFQVTISVKEMDKFRETYTE